MPAIQAALLVFAVRSVRSLLLRTGLLEVLLNHFFRLQSDFVLKTTTFYIKKAANIRQASKHTTVYRHAEGNKIHVKMLHWFQHFSLALYREWKGGIYET